MDCNVKVLVQHLQIGKKCGNQQFKKKIKLIQNGRAYTILTLSGVRLDGSPLGWLRLNPKREAVYG